MRKKCCHVKNEVIRARFIYVSFLRVFFFCLQLFCVDFFFRKKKQSLEIFNYHNYLLNLRESVCTRSIKQKHQINNTANWKDLKRSRHFCIVWFIVISYVSTWILNTKIVFLDTKKKTKFHNEKTQEMSRERKKEAFSASPGILLFSVFHPLSNWFRHAQTIFHSAKRKQIDQIHVLK